MSEKKEKKKRNRRKPKYNIWQNTVYMFGYAAKKKPSVIVFMFLGLFLNLCGKLVDLFVAPAVLGEVERGSSLQTLVFTIAFFAAAIILIRWFTSYIQANGDLGKVYLRVSVIEQICLKQMRTSFPNTENHEFTGKCNYCKGRLWDGAGVPEAIWGNFSNILMNVSGFIIYLFLISNVDILLAVLCIVISLIVFFINRKLNRWSYEHRDEEAEFTGHLYWMNDCAHDMNIAKDIRIFGMADWLKGLYKRTLSLYNEFIKKGVKHYMLGDIVGIVADILRNGIVYVYLIIFTVNNGLSAAEFLLYLNAVSGFSEWIFGMINCYFGLQNQSYNLSIIRELLETPEPFAFEEGKSLNPEENKKYDIELRNVSFKYPNSEKYVLKNINLHIKAGENIAVVGLNGAGKTTLVKIICGF